MVRITKSNEAPPFPGGSYRMYVAGNVYTPLTDPPGTPALAARAVREGWGEYDPPLPVPAAVEPPMPLAEAVAEALGLDGEPPLAAEIPKQDLFEGHYGYTFENPRPRDPEVLTFADVGSLSDLGLDLPPNVFMHDGKAEIKPFTEFPAPIELAAIVEVEPEPPAALDPYPPKPAKRKRSK